MNRFGLINEVATLSAVHGIFLSVPGSKLRSQSDV